MRAASIGWLAMGQVFREQLLGALYDCGDVGMILAWNASQCAGDDHLSFVLRFHCALLRRFALAR